MPFETGLGHQRSNQVVQSFDTYCIEDNARRKRVSYQGILRNGDQKCITLVPDEKSGEEMNSLACAIGQEQLRRVSLDAAIPSLNTLHRSKLSKALSGCFILPCTNVF